jgi:hypothetical protein
MMKYRFYPIIFLLFAASLSGCHVYSFKDAVIPVDVKTIKIGYFDNTARYVNPQVTQLMTDKLQQKVIGGTRLTRTNDEGADYVINGTVTNYDATQTVGVSAQQASANRLTVTIHVIWRNNVKGGEKKEFDVSRSYDYAASLSMQQAEAKLLDEMVRTLTDDIYNKIFSDW